MPIRVSAVMPIHNEAKVLADVLGCIEGQTHRPDELILVFDRCTDTSRAIARGRSDVDLVVDFGNMGVAVRTAIDRARYDTILIFDGNTLVPPDYVERLLSAYAETKADITEWHGGLMLFPKSTVVRFGPPSDRALWTLEFFLRVERAGGVVDRLGGQFVRLTPSPLHRNLRYGLDYADLCWQYGLAPFFRVGTKSGWLPDFVAIAGVLAGHARNRRLGPAIVQSLGYLRRILRAPPIRE